MSSYPICFHDSSPDMAKAKLPQRMPSALRAALADKIVCVPFYDANGSPVLLLHNEEEYRRWKERLPKDISPDHSCRVLQLLAQHMPVGKGQLKVSRQLLSFAHITCDAALCFSYDGLVWLAPGEMKA